MALVNSIFSKFDVYEDDNSKARLKFNKRKCLWYLEGSI